MRNFGIRLHVLVQSLALQGEVTDRCPCNRRRSRGFAGPDADLAYEAPLGTTTNRPSIDQDVDLPGFEENEMRNQFALASQLSARLGVQPEADPNKAAYLIGIQHRHDLAIERSFLIIESSRIISIR